MNNGGNRGDLIWKIFHCHLTGIPAFLSNGEETGELLTSINGTKAR